MKWTKKHWFWNVLLVFTFVLCGGILAMHYKNYVTVGKDDIIFLSGFYRKSIAYGKLDSVILVAHLPAMERLNGFSGLKKEKGIFKRVQDSLFDKKIAVFLDNIEQSKIKLVYNDSVVLYANLRDSLETSLLLEQLKTKVKQNTNNVD